MNNRISRTDTVNTKPSPVSQLMKKTIGTETDNIESSTETKTLVANTPVRMSDHEIKNSSSLSITSEEVFRQNRAVTDPLTQQQLTHLCGLMRELMNDQTNRHHEETASFRSTSSSSGSESRSDAYAWFDQRFSCLYSGLPTKN